ncbi:PTS sugar transporter subunit IIA [Streptomyces sp. NPDC001037]|uniref:PTS sugar transporter subunit IIA n=1 Tax=Streptomyces sp. NPDC001037 TaxID=3364542 RepID=UPI00369297E3
MIQIIGAFEAHASDWRAAVRVSAGSLVNLGVATADSPDTCIRVVEDTGPYIVLAPGLALVHARPEDGGAAVGITATRLTEPVVFGHPQNDPVDLLLAICSPNKAAHVATMSALARALGDGLTDRLRAASDGSKLTAILQEIFQDV